MIIPSGDKMAEASATLILKELERVTGVRFVVEENARLQLDRRPTGVLRELVVPREQVWAVAESMLANARIGLSFITEQPPVVMSVWSLDSLPTAKPVAVAVAPDELPSWKLHAAVIITTSVTFDALNVRDVSNSMRQTLTDPRVQQIVPVGNSNMLMFTGFAPKVAELVSSLQAANASERARIAEAARLSEVERSQLNAANGVARPK